MQPLEISPQYAIMAAGAPAPDPPSVLGSRKPRPRSLTPEYFHSPYFRDQLVAAPLKHRAAVLRRFIPRHLPTHPSQPHRTAAPAPLPSPHHTPSSFFARSQLTDPARLRSAFPAPSPLSPLAPRI